MVVGKSALLVGATATLVAAQPATICMEKYQCVFHHNVGSGANTVEWSWDMHQLCDPTGAGYTMYNDTGEHTYKFNVCGMSSSLCSTLLTDTPPTWERMYDNYGSAVQFWGTAPSPQPSPQVCQDCSTAFPNGPDPACKIVDCTAPCIVLATEAFQFQLLDESNPANGGVQFIYYGMPPPDQAAAQCNNGANNLPMEREVRLQIGCDPTVPGLAVDMAYETDLQCRYVIVARSSAACGTQGDPYDIPPGYGPVTSQTGTQFGYTVLGMVLAVVVYFIYGFGDQRGWWNPIKNVLSRIPVIGRFCGGYSGGVGSGAGYKPAGASAGGFGSATATPIAASAYGT